MTEATTKEILRRCEGNISLFGFSLIELEEALKKSQESLRKSTRETCKYELEREIKNLKKARKQ